MEQYTLRTILTAVMAQALVNSKTDPGFYRGARQYQLTDGEIAVFGIDPARWPVQVEVFQCYLCFKAIETDKDWNMKYQYALDKAKEDDLDWEAETINVVEFHWFARTFAGLRSVEAGSVWAKYRWWDIRAGNLVYADTDSPEDQETEGRL